MARTITCHVGTRKGLFTIARGTSAWSVSRVSFLGDNCTLAVHDPRNDSLFVESWPLRRKAASIARRRRHVDGNRRAGISTDAGRLRSENDIQWKTNRLDVAPDMGSCVRW